MARSLFRKRPPWELPENLSADEYYKLGIDYKLAGWISQSKRALRLAIIKEPDGIGKLAAVYLKAYLPKNEISQEAIRDNIAAVNQSVFDREGAKQAYLTLIETYPDFEWPYGNLGQLYAGGGSLEEAKSVLNKAIEINPDYVNGLLHLAFTYSKENNQAEVDRLLERLLAIDPEVKSNVLETYPNLQSRLRDLKCRSH